LGAYALIICIIHAGQLTTETLGTSKTQAAREEAGGKKV
jgi:hypothetical protein